MAFDLSPDQQRLVEWDTKADGDLFAEACPGAGKTRAIVARYLRLTEQEPRKGIAMLSFTNAAVDEVKARCGDRPEALCAPNYVGTFDSFINRFITELPYVSEYGKTPHFVETWEGKAAGVRASQMPGADFDLDWFAFDAQLRATLMEAWISRKSRNAVQPVIDARRPELERKAGSVARGLVAKGLISCTGSRALAMRYLADPDVSRRLKLLLANRFREIIVDEAQDCGPEELAILRFLRQLGVSVVAVADLDQSIYEFRRAEPASVQAFIGELPSRLLLSGNYRSSPAICALNNSLRAGSHVETASGSNKDCLFPVRILEYSSLGTVASAVTDLLDLHMVARQDIMFLAHARKDARESAGGRREEEASGNGAIPRIVAAHTILTSNASSPAERSRAIRQVESVLRTVAGYDDQTDSELDERWLRNAAVRLAVTLKPGAVAREYADRVRRYVEDIQWPDGTGPRVSLGNTLKAPVQDKWSPVGQLERSPAFAWGTVHSVKGREFPGVVVVLPRKLLEDDHGHTVLDHWEQNKPSELRRVLYVGASRAQRLLILAVHATQCDRVITLLKQDGVPYDPV